MSNVMSLKSFSNNVKRNGFDLSFKNAFTAKAGELLPVMVKEVIPGDKFKISAQSFTRTQPLNTAAFVRMREYYDVFFVPYRLLWSRYPTFFTNLPDYHRSRSINSAGSVGDMHPYFTSDQIQGYLKRIADLPSTGEESFKKFNFFGFDRGNLTCKLLDYLGYGFSPLSSVGTSRGMVMNPNPLLAYQKIYQDFYRDDQWEKAAPFTYNLDYIEDSETVNIPVESIDLSDTTMFDLRYCNWQKDYFMGMLPSPQYGDESFVPINVGNVSVNSNLNLDNAYITNGPVGLVGNGAVNVSLPADIKAFDAASGVTERLLVPVDSLGNNYDNAYAGVTLNPHELLNGVGVDSSVNGLSSSSRLSVLALRQAECLQKWKEISQSGKQDYRTQMQKHFGVTPSYAMSDHCQYVGGWTTNLDINEVVNTNLSSDDSSANIFGKGVATGNGGCDFDAKEHGILMVIYHNMPLLDWDSFGAKRLNLKSSFTDYAISEFDSIGMQQLFPSELLSPLMSTSEGESSIELGYVPRYADYKTAYDEIHGAFHDTLVGWVAPLSATWWRTYIGNVFNRYGSIRIVYEFFKVNPQILDNLFGVNADSSTSTDQFLINSFFDVKCVRNLDYNGLPY